MLVSHQYKFIYTKTMKTAGTSVEVYFEKYCCNPAKYKMCHSRPEEETNFGIIGARGKTISAESKWWNHMPAQQIKNQLGNDVWNNYFKFCVIRNPFDRLVSEFYFRIFQYQNNEKFKLYHDFKELYQSGLSEVIFFSRMDKNARIYRRK